MPEKVGRRTRSQYSFDDLNNIERTLGSLRRLGIGELTPEYQGLYRLRGEIMGRLGLRAPKAISVIARVVGLSPGEIRVIYDPEAGWISETRERPGAPPVRKVVSDEVAVAIIKREVTPQLEKELLTPVTDIDN